MDEINIKFLISNSIKKDKKIWLNEKHRVVIITTYILNNGVKFQSYKIGLKYSLRYYVDYNNNTVYFSKNKTKSILCCHDLGGKFEIKYDEYLDYFIKNFLGDYIYVDSYSKIICNWIPNIFVVPHKKAFDMICCERIEIDNLTCDDNKIDIEKFECRVLIYNGEFLKIPNIKSAKKFIFLHFLFNICIYRIKCNL